MDKESEEKLTEYFTEKLKEQYQRGLAVGVKTVAKVVLDKLNDSSMSFMRRVSEIRKFCNSPFVLNKKPETNGESKQETDSKTPSTNDESGKVDEGAVDDVESP